MKRALMLGAMWIWLAGCAAGGGEPTAAPPSLSLATLQNAKYHSADWGDFQLVQGVFQRTPLNPLESPSTYQTRFQEPVFYGDLNDDDLEDALVILATQNGGTGHFVELAAVINRDGEPENVSTVALGDRVVVEAARIEKGAITLDMRVHGASDGLCCPSQSETWRFQLEGSRLVRLR